VFEKGGVGALGAAFDHHHGDAAELEPGRAAELHGGAREDAAPSGDTAVGEGADFGLGGEGTGEGVLAGFAVEAGLEAGAETEGVGFASQFGVVEDAEDGALDAGRVEGLEQGGGVAAAAAAGLSATSAKASGTSVASARWVASASGVRFATKRSRRAQAASASSSARVSAACWCVAVTTAQRPLNGVSP
jgi:hypothetical protein